MRYEGAFVTSSTGISRTCRATGKIFTHEAYFYGLDALPLWLGMSLFYLVWPPRVLHQTNGDAAAGTGVPLHQTGSRPESEMELNVVVPARDVAHSEA